MLPPKPLIVGLSMLLIGVSAFAYNMTRPLPPVAPLPTEDLHAAETQPTPSVEPSPAPAAATTTATSPRAVGKAAPPVRRAASPRQTPPPPKSYKIYLTSPSMAETHTAPASLRVKARVRRTAGDAVTKVEFFYTQVSSKGRNFCRSLTHPTFTRASAADAALPANHSLEEHLKRGYTSIGETTSAPYEMAWNDVAEGNYSVIAVATYASGAQQFSPQVAVVVNKSESYDGAEWQGWRPQHQERQQPEQDAALMPTPTPTPTLSICPQITVSNLGEPQRRGEVVKLKASLEGGEIPPDVKYEWTTSTGVLVDQQGTPSMSIDTKGVFDETLVAAVEVRGLNAICPNTASHTVPFIEPRRLSRDARNALAVANMFVDPSNNPRWIDLRIEMANDEKASVYIILRSRDNCVDERSLKEVRLGKDYLVKSLGTEPARIHIVNGGSTENSAASPSYELWVVPEGTEPPRTKRDAAGGELPLVPCPTAVRETAVRETDEVLNRACPDLAETPDFNTSTDSEHEVNTCPYNARDPQNSSAQLSLGTTVRATVLANYPTFKYWPNGGKISASDGQQAVWDLSALKLRRGRYTAVVKADDGCDCESVTLRQVRATNFCTPCLRKLAFTRYDLNCAQTFTVEVEDFAVDRPTTFHWTTTKGRIIRGQGTASVTVDTSMLDEGTPFTVTVGVGGLYRYCVNKLSQSAVATRNCPQIVRRFDEFPSITFDPPTPPRYARRRRHQGTEERTPPDATNEDAQSSPTTPTGTANPGATPETTAARPKEKEWIDVAWSPRVEVQRSFPVVVIYKRTEETLEVKDEAGKILEELRLAESFKLLKERFGKDYEVLAQVRLRTSGFKCDGCGEELFQSLDAKRVEWSWSLTSHDAGKQTFNLEMLIKGVRRGTNSDEGATRVERVWGKNGLEVNVYVPTFTRYRLHVLSALFAFTGIGFSFKGVKIIYKRGDTYNVGQAVAVGRNVEMNNTTVNQQQDEMTVRQNAEEKRDG